MVRRSRWAAELGHARPVQQSRSQRTHTALLDAAQALFAEAGVEGTTVTDIVERADCSVGSFYHHFRDKRAIQYAVADRYASGTEKLVVELLEPRMWAGATVADIVDAVVRVAITYDADEPRAKIAIRRIAAVETDIARTVEKLDNLIGEGIVALLDERHDEIAHATPALAVRTAVQMMLASLVERLDRQPGTTRSGPDDDEQYATEVVRALCAYLGVPLPVH